MGSNVAAHYREAEMSSKFYAVNRETGEQWKPSEDTINREEFLVITTEGSLGLVIETGYWRTEFYPLCPETWKIVYNTKD